MLISLLAHLSFVSLSLCNLAYRSPQLEEPLCRTPKGMPSLILYPLIMPSSWITPLPKEPSLPSLELCRTRSSRRKVFESSEHHNPPRHACGLRIAASVSFAPAQVRKHASYKGVTANHSSLDPTRSGYDVEGVPRELRPIE